MNKQDWQSLKQEAQNFMDDIGDVDSANMSDIEYAMLGASIAILDHADSDGVNPSPDYQKRTTGEYEAQSGKLDDFNDILARYNDSRSAADQEKMRAVLKQQLDNILKELTEMRLEVHDGQCVQMFVDFREEIRLRI